jgi:hypothetical protein
LSTLLHATVYVLHNLLNVLVQITNKIGFKKLWEIPTSIPPPPPAEMEMVAQELKRGGTRT